MKKRRADLWEDTIIIAMRDMQWSNVIRKLVAKAPSQGSESIAPIFAETEGRSDAIPKVLPPGLAKLDGNAEKKLSDVVLREGERFFLMEVKSSLSKVRTEWRRNGKYDPKFMLERLSELAACAEQNVAAEQMLRLSLRGHYATYWAGRPVENGLRGTVVSMPYITACAAARTLEDISKDRGGRPPNGFSPRLLETSSDASIPGTFIQVSSLLRGRVTMQLRPGETFARVGLTKDEFIEYVAFLCGEGASVSGFELPSDSSVDARPFEPVHLVSLSNFGTHMKVMGSTADLVTLLYGDFGPHPTPGRSASVGF